ncbi:hypothetical protein [Aureicoccus marinus]|nr:hypothetical protein [Aureicoccus marinus]
MSEQPSFGTNMLNAVLRLMVFVLLLILASVVISIGLNFLGLLPES